MAIAFRAAGSAATANSGDVSPGLPAGTAEGDLLVLLVASRDNVSVSLPGGWTKAGELNNGSLMRTTFAWKIAGASESAPTVTHTAGGTLMARIAGFYGTNTGADPTCGYGQQTNAGGTTNMTAPSVTPTSGTRNLQLLLIGHNQNQTATAESVGASVPAWNEAIDSQFVGDRNIALWLGWRLWDSAAASGTHYAALDSGSGLGNGAQLFIAPPTEARLDVRSTSSAGPTAMAALGAVVHGRAKSSGQPTASGALGGLVREQSRSGHGSGEASGVGAIAGTVGGSITSRAAAGGSNESGGVIPLELRKNYARGIGRALARAAGAAASAGSAVSRALSAAELRGHGAVTGRAVGLVLARAGAAAMASIVGRAVSRALSAAGLVGQGAVTGLASGSALARTAALAMASLIGRALGSGRARAGAAATPSLIGLALGVGRARAGAAGARLTSGLARGLGAARGMGAGLGALAGRALGAALARLGDGLAQGTPITKRQETVLSAQTSVLDELPKRSQGLGAQVSVLDRVSKVAPPELVAQVTFGGVVFNRAQTTIPLEQEELDFGHEEALQGLTEAVVSGRARSVARLFALASSLGRVFGRGGATTGAQASAPLAGSSSGAAKGSAGLEGDGSTGAHARGLGALAGGAQAQGLTGGVASGSAPSSAPLFARGRSTGRAAGRGSMSMDSLDPYLIEGSSSGSAKSSAGLDGGGGAGGRARGIASLAVGSLAAIKTAGFAIGRSLLSGLAAAAAAAGARAGGRASLEGRATTTATISGRSAGVGRSSARLASRAKTGGEAAGKVSLAVGSLVAILTAGFARGRSLLSGLAAAAGAAGARARGATALQGRAVATGKTGGRSGGVARSSARLSATAKTRGLAAGDVTLTVTDYSAPSVVTAVVDQITSTSARISGTCNPNGSPATVAWAEVLDAQSVVVASSTPVNVGGGTVPVDVIATIPGLAPSTSYFGRIVGDNGNASGFGASLPFTTNPPVANLPTIVVNTPTSVTSDGAAMRCTVTTPGSAAIITFEFRNVVGPGPWIAAKYGPIRHSPHSDTWQYWGTAYGCTPGGTYEYRATVVNNEGSDVDGPSAASTFTVKALYAECAWDQNQAKAGVSSPTWADPRDPASGLISEFNPRRSISNSERSGGASTGGVIRAFDIIGYGLGNPSGKAPGTMEVYWETPFPKVYAPAAGKKWLARCIEKAVCGDKIGWEGFDGTALTAAGANGCCIGGKNSGSPNNSDAFWKSGAAYVAVTGITIRGIGTQIAAGPSVLYSGEPAAQIEFGGVWGGCNNVYVENIKLMSVGTAGGGNNVILPVGSYVGLFGFKDCIRRAYDERPGGLQNGFGTKSHVRTSGRCRIDDRGSIMSQCLEHSWYVTCLGSEVSGVDGSWFIGLRPLVNLGTPDKNFRSFFQLESRNRTYAQISDGSSGPAGRGALLIKDCEMPLNTTSGPLDANSAITIYGHLGPITIDCQNLKDTGSILVSPDIAKGAWVELFPDGNYYVHSTVTLRMFKSTVTDTWNTVCFEILGTYDIIIEAFDLHSSNGMTVDLFPGRGSANVGMHAGVDIGDNGRFTIVNPDPPSNNVPPVWAQGGKVRWHRSTTFNPTTDELVWSNAKVDSAKFTVVRPDFGTP